MTSGRRAGGVALALVVMLGTACGAAFRERSSPAAHGAGPIASLDDEPGSPSTANRSRQRVAGDVQGGADAGVPAGDTSRGEDGPRARGVTATPGGPPVVVQPPPGVAAGRGIEGGRLKMGFIYVSDFQSFGATFGFNPPQTGDASAQARAVADWVNANGGIGGYELVPVVRPYNPQNASQGAEEALCTAFTQDDKVFAVMLEAQIYRASRDCYAANDTVMIESSLFAFDDDFIAEHSPYYWAPSYPSYSKVFPALIPSLARRGFFSGDARLGVLQWDTPVYDRIVETDLLPQLSAQGVEVAARQKVDPTDVGTIQSGLTNAVFAFRTAQVNRVVFAGSNPLQPFFMITAEGANYRPRYGMTTFDNPYFTEDNEGWNGQVRSAIGIGFNPASDVGDDHYPFPHPRHGIEPLCLDIVATRGEVFTRRYDARQALAICESALFLRHVASITGPGLNSATFGRAAASIGGAFQSANGFLSLLTDRHHDGGNGYREIAFDNSCVCWSYTSDVRRFIDG